MRVGKLNINCGVGSFVENQLCVIAKYVVYCMKGESGMIYSKISCYKIDKLDAL